MSGLRLEAPGTGTGMGVTRVRMQFLLVVSEGGRKGDTKPENE